MAHELSNDTTNVEDEKPVNLRKVICSLNSLMNRSSGWPVCSDSTGDLLQPKLLKGFRVISGDFYAFILERTGHPLL